MMQSYFYKDRFAEAETLLQPGTWLHVEQPDDAERSFLLSMCGVPEDFMSDMADADERPRIEREDGMTAMVLRIPRKNDEGKIPYSTVPLGIVAYSDKIITISPFLNDVVNDFLQYARKRNLAVNTPHDLILRLMTSASVWFMKYMKQINTEVAHAESILEKSIRNEDLLRLMYLDKSMVFFNASIRGNEMTMVKFVNLLRSDVDYTHDIYEDTRVELRQAHAMVTIYSDILTGTMDSFASIISNNVNTIMKRMTAISLILMLPTLIASFYGMNVITYAESSPYGFFIILFVSLLLSAVTYFLLKWRNWI